MGNRPDSLVVSQARHQTAIHDLEDASLDFDRSVSALIEKAPHLAVALGGAMAVVHPRALFFSRAYAHPGGQFLGGSKRPRLGTNFGQDLLGRIDSQTGHLG